VTFVAAAVLSGRISKPAADDGGNYNSSYGAKPRDSMEVLKVSQRDPRPSLGMTSLLRVRRRHRLPEVNLGLGKTFL